MQGAVHFKPTGKFSLFQQNHSPRGLVLARVGLYPDSEEINTAGNR